jgi:HAD superfamily hydrolase (TIGR01509 family)
VIRAAIFDLDGTLFDSMGLWSALDVQFLQSFGLTPRPDLQEAVAPLTLRQSALYFRQEYGVPLAEDEIMAWLEAEIRRAYEELIPLKSGAFDALALLREKGIPMAGATATEIHLATAAMRRLGIFDFFEAVFTCEMVGHSKNEPQVFLAAAEHLGAAPGETWVFEDAFFAAQTAHDVGFHVAQVYDESAGYAGKFPCADVFLRDLTEIGHLLKD